jgi:hypothetical protein
MDKIMKLALEDKWDAVISELKNNSPIIADAFFQKYFAARKNSHFPLDEWTKEQEREFRQLASREYRINYYLKKGMENLTEEEWQDFKACEG